MESTNTHNDTRLTREEIDDINFAYILEHCSQQIKLDGKGKYPYVLAHLKSTINLMEKALDPSYEMK